MIDYLNAQSSTLFGPSLVRKLVFSAKDHHGRILKACYNITELYYLNGYRPSGESARILQEYIHPQRFHADLYVHDILTGFPTLLSLTDCFMSALTHLELDVKLGVDMDRLFNFPKFPRLSHLLIYCNHPMFVGASSSDSLEDVEVNPRENLKLFLENIPDTVQIFVVVLFGRVARIHNLFLPKTILEMVENMREPHVVFGCYDTDSLEEDHRLQETILLGGVYRWDEEHELSLRPKQRDIWKVIEGMIARRNEKHRETL